MRLKTWADLLGLYDRETIFLVMDALSSQVTTLRHVDPWGKETPAPASACPIEDWAFDEPTWRLVRSFCDTALQVLAEASENEPEEVGDDPDGD